YPVPDCVVAWLTTAEGRGERTALFSTSAARRRRGDVWLRPHREPTTADTPESSASRDGAPDRRQRPPNSIRYTPTRSAAVRRASAHGDPRRWLGELFAEGFVIIATETTGLRARDEVIEVAAVGSD